MKGFLVENGYMESISMHVLIVGNKNIVITELKMELP